MTAQVVRDAKKHEQELFDFIHEEVERVLTPDGNAYLAADAIFQRVVNGWYCMMPTTFDPFAEV